MTASARSTPETTAVWAVLDRVMDPEVPVLSVVELGIVRDVEIGPDRTVTVCVTPTYSGCPAMRVIEQDIVSALAAAGWARRPNPDCVRARVDDRLDDRGSAHKAQRVRHRAAASSSRRDHGVGAAAAHSAARPMSVLRVYRDHEPQRVRVDCVQGTDVLRRVPTTVRVVQSPVTRTSRSPASHQADQPAVGGTAVQPGTSRHHLNKPTWRGIAYHALVSRKLDDIEEETNRNQERRAA